MGSTVVPAGQGRPPRSATSPVQSQPGMCPLIQGGPAEPPRPLLHSPLQPGATSSFLIFQKEQNKTAFFLGRRNHQLNTSGVSFFMSRLSRCQRNFKNHEQEILYPTFPLKPSHTCQFDVEKSLNLTVETSLQLDRPTWAELMAPLSGRSSHPAQLGARSFRHEIRMDTTDNATGPSSGGLVAQQGFVSSSPGNTRPHYHVLPGASVPTTRTCV